MYKAQKIIVLVIITGFVICTTSIYANELVNAAAMGDLKQVKSLWGQSLISD